MWRVVLLFVIVSAVGIAGGWGLRYTYRLLHAAPAEPVVVAPVAAPPASSVVLPSHDERVEKVSREKSDRIPGVQEEEPEPIYCTGVSLRNGQVVVQWSDGSRQSAMDFAMFGQRLRLTSTSVWVDEQRFPILEHRRPRDVGGVGAAPVAGVSPVAAVAVAAAAATTPAGGDHPTWAYSAQTGVWYLRDRSEAIGGSSR